MPLRKTLSEREEELPMGSMGKLLKIAVEKKDIISFGPGEPDYLPPEHIIKAAQRALKKGFTHYSPPAGRIELIEEIVKKLKRENNINLIPKEVIVTTGSTEAIMLALMCVIDPGECVLVPDPGFITYIPTVEILNGYPISMPLFERNGFQFDTDQIRKIAEKTKRIRAMILNSPSNPTGTVYTKKVLEELADIANENDLLIISDEAYEKFVYRGSHISIGSLKGMKNRVLTLQSFSKTYGMAGFRVGYAAGPKKIIDAMKKLHIYSTLCTPTVSQIAAISALTGSQAEIKRNVTEYNKRRRFMVKRINEIDHLSCLEPEGSFYAFVNFDLKMNSIKFSELLLKKAKVAVVPGRDFGRYGEGYVRFSYATSMKNIEEGMNRIESKIKRLKK
ncbi:MAG: pyridoxal phosphate-dependent aminotransferase [Candidatus Aenigmatarchaeota archaeon]